MGALIHHPPAVFFASVDGLDVSSAFNQYLIKLTIVDAGGDGADHADLLFDDTGGQLAMPRTGAVIILGLGWRDTGPIEVFMGYTDAPRSFGSREGGRLLSIRATSSSPTGLVKQTFDVHQDGGTFGSAAESFGKLAGLTVQMDPALGKIPGTYWSMGKRSFPQWAAAMGQQLGALVKISGTTARFMPLAGGNTPGGEAFPTVVCEAGANLIRWELTPVYNQPKFGSFKTHWYDLDTAEHHYEELSGNAPAVKAALINRFKVFSQIQAQQLNGSNMTKNNDLDESENHIVIDGEPTAVSQGIAEVVGARPGIDGSYRIETATHVLSRAHGYITELLVREPMAGGSGAPSSAAPFQEVPSSP